MSVVRIIPPFVFAWRRRLLGIKPSHEYVPDGWAYPARGWAVAQTILVKYDFSRGPISPSILTHNELMSWAYVVGLARPDSILDWGCGTGVYYAVTKALYPGLSFAYHGVELPDLVKLLQKLYPDSLFWENKIWENRLWRGAYFDLVAANGSLQYAEDWKELLNDLAQSTRHYLYLSRLPLVEGPPFVFLQRARQTELLAWCLNRTELLEACASLGLRLRREFIYGPYPRIEHAPEQCAYAGFLFER